MYNPLSIEQLRTLIPGAVKRLCLFASYSNDSELGDSYYYCSELAKHFDLVIIITNSREINKIPNKCVVAYVPNYNRDFGLWWRVLNNLKQSRSVSLEMIGLVNDSCELLNSLKYTFRQGLGSKSEFWGITDGENERPWHIQSYFLIFQGKAINLLDEFVQSHKFGNTELLKDEIIRDYEIGLSQWMMNKVKSYVLYPVEKLKKIPSPYQCKPTNPSWWMWDKLLIAGCPLLKKLRHHYPNEKFFIECFRRKDFID